MTNWNEIKLKAQELYDALSEDTLRNCDNKVGIYGLYVNDYLLYVGQSKNILKRWIAHEINTCFNFGQKDYLELKYSIFRKLIKQGHHIQGKIIEECSEQDLNVKEKHWIRTLNPPLNGGRKSIMARLNEGVLLNVLN